MKPDDLFGLAIGAMACCFNDPGVAVMFFVFLAVATAAMLAVWQAKDEGWL